MLQDDIQAVPSTPQTGTRSPQHELNSNQQVPNWDPDSQDNDVYVVPRTPITTEDRCSPAISTPPYGRTYNSNKFTSLFDHFRTPRNFATESAFTPEQLVPASPNSRMISLKYGQQSSRTPKPYNSADLVDSPDIPGSKLTPQVPATPKLWQRLSRSIIENRRAPQPVDLRKQLLSRNHEKLVHEMTVLPELQHSLDNNHGQKSSVSQMLGKTNFPNGNSDNNAYHLEHDKLSFILFNKGRRAKRRIAEVVRPEESDAINHNADFLDIIDEEIVS